MLYLHVLLSFYILNWTKHKFRYLCVSTDFFNQSVTYLKYSGMSLVCPNLQRKVLSINSLYQLSASYKSIYSPLHIFNKNMEFFGPGLSE